MKIMIGNFSRNQFSEIQLAHAPCQSLTFDANVHFSLRSEFVLIHHEITDFNFNYLSYGPFEC